MALTRNYNAPINYIGETMDGDPGAVFFGAHSAIANNRPPISIITGKPGMGKTNLGLTLTMMSILTGCTTVVLDYKGDFLSLTQLEHQTGPINVQQVGGDGTEGSLDPMLMSSDPAEQIRLSMSLIDIFCGGLTDEQSIAVSPIVMDVIKSGRPTMGRVVQELRSSRKKDAQNVGYKLHVLRQIPTSKVCFDDGKGARRNIKVTGGTTIVTLLGLQLPKDAAEARETREGRLGAGIFYLVADMIRSVLKESGDNRPKTLVIDEAWAVLMSEHGRRIVKDVALLGRSRKLACILATQNYSHLDEVDIDNTISTHFCFSAGKEDAKKAVQRLDLKDDSFAESIVALEPGQMLMKDWEGDFATVRVVQWRDDWKHAFSTNPFL